MSAPKLSAEQLRQTRVMLACDRAGCDCPGVGVHQLLTEHAAQAARIEELESEVKVLREYYSSARAVGRSEQDPYTLSASRRAVEAFDAARAGKAGT